MIPARAITRTALPKAARSARVPRPQQLRLQSTTSSASTGSAGSSPFLSGAIGGLVAGAGLYGICEYDTIS